MRNLIVKTCENVENVLKNQSKIFSAFCMMQNQSKIVKINGNKKERDLEESRV